MSRNEQSGSTNQVAAKQSLCPLIQVSHMLCSSCLNFAQEVEFLIEQRMGVISLRHSRYLLKSIQRSHQESNLDVTLRSAS